ncbi:enoyl-CoA hydratase/isomerase family protein [Effusibacillus pohliae]|uniref:enoyl-CoA hydratase/isomerase family protein n=1 Tax=Effusibacillus pohliae TaxID=232270 RepID=UPI0003616488|nr:enoyl-CoA hydratase-related protein [Effusibacillus pohliae]
MYETVNYRVENRIATIQICVPQKMNALNLAVHRDLYAAFSAANEDADVRCIVLTGEGRAFSAGADLSEFDGTIEKPDYASYLKDTYNNLLRLMMQIKKPILAAVNGAAAGAGLSLALACDFRVASQDAKLSLAFIKIGLIPDAGACFFMPRLVGLGKAMELAALGSAITAEEAEKIGLVNKVLPAGRFAEGVAEFAGQLADLPTLAFGKMKEIMYKSMENDLDTVLRWEEEGQNFAGATLDHREGVMAFLEKRKPTFKGV